MNKLFFAAIFLSLFSMNSFAQNENPPVTPADNQPQPPSNNPTVQPPLELPTFIIEGVEQLNIKAGMKQFPSPPTVLSMTELDSLNPLEKQQSLLVPPPSMPKGLEVQRYANGFLQAKGGMYATFDVLAGYGLKYEGYELYGKAGLATSSGDVKNSDYGKFFVNINSDYIAPDIFWIFGGSRTRTILNYTNSSFNQYGTIANLARKVNDFDISLVSDGNYEGVSFSTGAGFRTLSINQNVNGIDETCINGFLKVNSLFDDNLIGGKIDINIGTYQGKSMKLIDIAVSDEIYKDKMTFDGMLGYQLAAASDGANQNSIIGKLGMSYLPNEKISIRGEFFTGLEKVFFHNHFYVNSYFDDFSNILLFPKINFALSGIVQYLPHPKLGLTVSGGAKIYDKYAYFNSLDSNKIELLFEQASVLFVKAELFYELSNVDKLIGFAGLNFGVLDYHSNAIPYLPMMEATLSYERNWFGKLSTEAGILFNSKRYTDKDNKKEINSYFNLFANINYNILNNFKIIAELKNLTNNDNFIWQGYKERGIFGSIGISWNF